MKTNSLKNTMKIATVAAIYVAMTLVLGDFSFGPLQMRVSEVLMLLCFFNKKYGYGLIVGCAIANCFSTLGPIDIIMGTLATAFSVFAITRCKNLVVAAIWTPLFNGLIIGFELYWVLELPFILTALQVFLGEAIAMIISVSLFTILKKNKGFLEVIELGGKNNE